jgi:hypothetical protein
MNALDRILDRVDDLKKSGADRWGALIRFDLQLEVVST